MLAFGQAGFSTGGSDGCVDNFGVTQSVNNFLGNDDCATDGAVLAFGLTGCGTGGGDCCVNDFSVAQSGNDLLSNDDFTTDGAVLAFGLTGCGTGGGDCCVDDFGVAQGCAFGCTADGAGLGGVAVGGCPVVAQGCAFGCTTDGAGLGRIAVGIYPFVLRTGSSPFTICIGVCSRSCSCSSFCKGPIRIFQLSGGDGNFNIGNFLTIIDCRLCCLISNRIGTRFGNHLTVSGTIDIGTGFSCIDITICTIDGTIYQKFSIYKRTFCTLCNPVIGVVQRTEN